MDIATADQLVGARINQAQSAANDLLARAESTAQDVIAASNGWFTPGQIEMVKKPDVKIPDFYASTDLAKLFDEKYNNMLGDLQGKFFPLFDELVAKYFPKLNAKLNGDMESWLDDTIVNGGVGLPPAIENAIVQRAKDREMDVASTLKDQAVHEFAARGYDLPSGALASRFAQVDLEAQKKIAELNRDTAINAYKERIETVKFAITQAVDLRKHAYGFIKDLMLNYINLSDVAARVAESEVKAYQALWAATAEYYRAVTTIQGMLIDVDKFNADMKYRLMDMSFRTFQVSLQTRTTAATSVADLYARAASSYLNAQTTITAIESRAEYASAGV